MNVLVVVAGAGGRLDAVSSATDETGREHAVSRWQRTTLYKKFSEGRVQTLAADLPSPQVLLSSELCDCTNNSSSVNIALG